MSELIFLNDADDKLRIFATHMAQEIESFEAICKRCGLTVQQGEKLKATPAYLKYYEKELLRFNSPENAAAKLQRCMDELAIFMMPGIVTMFHDPDTSDTAKANLVGTVFKHSSIGGTAAKQAGGGGGDTVKITINLGADQKLTFEKPVPVIEHEAAE